MKNGYTSRRSATPPIGGVSSAMGAIFILLAVGALIGTWNMAGTIPTVVVLRHRAPQSRRSSTPAVGDHLRAGRAGHGQLVDDRRRPSGWRSSAWRRSSASSPTIAAGAIISGAYFGDKMSPMSETTVLVPSLVGGVTTNEHIGAMIWTSGPASVWRSSSSRSSASRPPPRPAFDPTAGPGGSSPPNSRSRPLNLLPLVLLVVLRAAGTAVPGDLRLRRCSPASWPRSPSRPRSQAFVDEPGQGAVARASRRSTPAMANGFVSKTRQRRRSTRCSPAAAWPACSRRSGSCSARSASRRSWSTRLPGAAHPAGRRSRDVHRAPHRRGHRHVHRPQHRRGRPVRRRSSCPAAMYRAEFATRGIAPRMLSRAVEDSGTVTSALIPWNSCGAYMAGVLGVATIAYLPYCFFNLAEPGHVADLRVHRVPHRAHPARPEPRRRADACRPPADDPSPQKEDPHDERCRSGPAGPPATGDARRVRTAVRLHDPVHPHRHRRALATWIIPAGEYELDADGAPIPGTYQQVDREPAADRRRLADGADQRPLRHRGRGRQRQHLEQRRAVRRHRRRAVHPRHRRIPRA